jgi:flagellar basal-body rod modification protein FlgD
MEIVPTNQTAAATAKKPAIEDASAMGAATSDFDTYLTLLTTQLRNQDPLKPTDSTEFVAQLASFSGVEQQIRTNDRLESILGALGGGSSAGLAAWIGKEVRAPAKAAFSGAPLEIETVPNAKADGATLVVTNDFGQVVARRAIDPKAEQITWDGRTALGDGVPYGDYSFEIEAYDGETLLGTEPGQIFAKVTEVRIEDGAQVLVLDGGERVALEDVTALR